jgi:cobalamin-dependent methionine synthase I
VCVTVIAQNLNASSSSFASALMGADAAWVRDHAFRLVATGVDALDLCVSSVAPALESEVALLDWTAQQVESVTDLPLFLDSPRSEVLLRCGRPRRSRPVLNSIGHEEWTELSEPTDRGVAGWVVQLRRGSQLPQSAEERLEWTAAFLGRFAPDEIPFERLWLDPVCLPWGDDLRAGAGLLDYLSESRRRWPQLRSLVGVGNLSWGHSDRAGLHRQWVPRLREAGARGFLLDPTEAGIVDLARG